MKCKRYSCNMEVDERLRWLEARISSSLRPKGGDLRNLLADARNRCVFGLIAATYYILSERAKLLSNTLTIVELRSCHSAITVKHDAFMCTCQVMPKDRFRFHPMPLKPSLTNPYFF